MRISGVWLGHRTSLILRCSYVVTIKCTLHFDVTMMSSYEMAHLDFVIFYTSRGLNAAESRTPIDLDSRATLSKYMGWAHNHLYKS